MAASASYDAAERPLHGALTAARRAHAFRSDLASYLRNVPESKVRVIAGDMGGSFGMKSAVYNEDAAHDARREKMTGRPVKWRAARVPRRS